MRGIILAGGDAANLRPLANANNKHLLSVAGRPMIAWGLDLMADLKIDDITIVTNRKDLISFQRLIGHKDLPSFEKVALFGQIDSRDAASALKALPKEKRDAPCAVLCADNLFEISLLQAREYFEFQKDKALVFLKHVDNIGESVVVELQKNLIASIEHHPEKPKSNLVATGLYFFPDDIFSIIDTLSPSTGGELRISDALQVYLDQGRLGYVIIDGWWVAVDSPEMLERADTLLAKKPAETNAERE